jgi:hypothetical protein
MPTAGAMLQEAIRVLRLDVVGFGGSLIHAAILALMTDTMNANPFAAHAVSVPVAIAFTFVSNGHGHSLLQEDRRSVDPFSPTFPPRARALFCN